MNKLLIFFFALLFSCNKSLENRTSETKKINLVLNQWHQAAADANFDAYFSFFDKKAVFIGTDPSEKWNIQKFKVYCKPYFRDKKTWDFKSIQRHIYIEDKIAWFDELLDTHMGICRGSGILKKDKNNWKIKQYVLSITIPNDHVKQVTSLKKEKDSLFIQNNKK